MSYSVIPGADGAPDLVLEDPDPRLLTRESRLALIREVRAIREALLERRGGVPLDLEEIVEEMRNDRGSHRS